jgi:hypothetical protein
VPVLARPRPLDESPGVQAGGLTIRPSLDESFGYNSNLTGAPNAPGSAFIETNPMVDIAADAARSRIGLNASLDSTVDLDAPAQTHTDATLAIGGSATIGRGEASLGYTHLSEHEDGTDIGAIATQTPIGYEVDDVRGEITTVIGPLLVTPNIDVADMRFGRATVDGQDVAQSYRNRVMVSGGATASYDTGAADLLLVLQARDSHYTDAAPGEPSADSRSAAVMAGFDTEAESLWRWRLLAGLEYRDFAAPRFGNHVEPIVQAGVTWTPSRMLTITGTVTRSLQEPQSAGIAGYAYTNARLTADYAWRRNVLVQGRLGVQEAEFLQGGSETILSAGAGATWAVNRNVHILLDYDFATGHGLPDRGSAYTQHRVVVRLHLAI